MLNFPLPSPPFLCQPHIWQSILRWLFLARFLIFNLIAQGNGIYVPVLCLHMLHTRVSLSISIISKQLAAFHQIWYKDTGLNYVNILCFTVVIRQKCYECICEGKSFGSSGLVLASTESRWWTLNAQLWENPLEFTLSGQTPQGIEAQSSKTLSSAAFGALCPVRLEILRTCETEWL